MSIMPVTIGVAMVPRQIESGLVDVGDGDGGLDERAGGSQAHAGTGAMTRATCPAKS